MREDINEGCGLIGEYACFKGIELENELRKLIEADFEEATSKIEKSFVEGDREPIKLKDTTGELFSVRIIYV